MTKDELGLGKLVERLLVERVGQTFDNECHLSSDEAAALAGAITALIAERDAATALPSQVVGGELFSMLQAAYLRGIAFARENGATPAEERKAAYDYADKTTSCLTSPAAEPVAWVVQLNYGNGRWSGNMLTDVLPSKNETQYRIIRPLFDHPAPSASREVTVTDEMVDAAIDALAAIMLQDGATRESSRTIMRAALLAALPEREG